MGKIAEQEQEPYLVKIGKITNKSYIFFIFMQYIQNIYKLSITFII